MRRGSPARKLTRYRRLESEFGREGITPYLEESPDPRFIGLTAALLDPDNGPVSFGAMCRRYSITPDEVFRQVLSARARMTLSMLASRLDKVIENLVTDAENGDREAAGLVLRMAGLIRH